jgi:hypothetical protein
MAECHECEALIEYQGNGTQRRYTFPFEYYERSEIYVSVYDPENNTFVDVPYGSEDDQWLLANPTTVALGKATKEKVRIYRCTDINPMRAVFQPGTAVKAKDLNDDFDQLRNAIEEAKCSSSAVGERLDYGYEVFLNRIEVGQTDDEYGFPGDLVTSRSRLVINDDVVPTTKWVDNRYWDICEQTTYSADTWSDENDDNHIPTTKAVEQRINDLIAQGGSGPGVGGVTRLIAGTNITISPTGGTGIVTINAIDNKLESVNASAPIIGSLSNNSLTLSFNMSSLPTR